MDLYHQEPDVRGRADLHTHIWRENKARGIQGPGEDDMGLLKVAADEAAALAVPATVITQGEKIKPVGDCFIVNLQNA